MISKKVYNKILKYFFYKKFIYNYYFINFYLMKNYQLISNNYTKLKKKYHKKINNNIIKLRQTKIL
jgi:hypothetical protein